METYEQANLEKASIALVLATDYDDPNSDAVVSSIVAVLENRHPEIYTVAECLDERHRILFDTTQCNSIVCGLQLSSNLLTQEMHDPGVAQTMEVITSNLIKPTVFSTEITDESPVDYPTLAKALIDRGCNVLSVIRGADTHTRLTDLSSARGDRLVYVADSRLPWTELRSLA